MDLQALKALAQDVTDWSNNDQAWRDPRDAGLAMVRRIGLYDDNNPVALIDCDQYGQPDDSIKLARFYAAANPAVVLQLIAMIESKVK